MKEKISKILLGILWLGIHSLEAGASYSAPRQTTVPRTLPAIQVLSPDQTADILRQLEQDGIINGNTLVVWDIDDTLIKSVSDQMISGAIPIHPYFTEFVDRTQKKGTTHVALTTGGAQYRNKFHGSFAKSVTPESFLVFEDDIQEEKDRLIPAYLRRSLRPRDTISFETLRIEGLKHIGIFLEDSFKNFKFFQSRQILGTLRDTWSGVSICAPVFWNGVISYNSVNSKTHLSYGCQKGYILQLFLDRYREQTGRKFSNVVFIDDMFLCVENMVEVMAEIGMPCVGINILTNKQKK
jgi:hypothetical protein